MSLLASLLAFVLGFGDARVRAGQHAEAETSRAESVGAELGMPLLADELRRLKESLQAWEEDKHATADLNGLPLTALEHYTEFLLPLLTRLSAWVAEQAIELRKCVEDLTGNRNKLERLIEERRIEVRRLEGALHGLDSDQCFHPIAALVLWGPGWAALAVFWIAVRLVTRRWWRARKRRREHMLPRLVATVMVASILAVPPAISFSIWEIRNLSVGSGHRAAMASQFDSVDEEQKQIEQGFVELTEKWRGVAVKDLGFPPNVVREWMDFRAKLIEVGELWARSEHLRQTLPSDRAYIEELEDRVVVLRRCMTDVGVCTALLLTGHWLAFAVIRGWIWMLTYAKCPKCGHYRRPNRSVDGWYQCQVRWTQPEVRGAKQGVGTEGTMHGAETDGGAKQRDRNHRQDSGKCLFNMEWHQLGAPKLYFASVGSKFVGKTAWLAAAYQSINLRLYDPSLHITRLPDLGTDEEDDLDNALSRIVQGGPEIAFPATERGIPKPRVFSVIDSDWNVTQPALVTIADFAGEVLDSSPKGDWLRKRMLDANGILLFVGLDDSNADRNTRFKAIRDFVSEAGSEHCTAPVAVCLSKVDELLAEGESRSSQLRAFFDDLAKIEEERPVGGASLQLIDQRHELTQALLEEMWPGDLRRELDRLIGRVYKFFPVTSFGYNRPKGPGQMKPWGDLEPLLWLLHVNGWLTLPSRNTRQHRAGRPLRGQRTRSQHSGGGP